MGYEEQKQYSDMAFVGFFIMVFLISCLGAYSIHKYVDGTQNREDIKCQELGFNESIPNKYTDHLECVGAGGLVVRPLSGNEDYGKKS